MFVTRHFFCLKPQPLQVPAMARIAGTAASRLLSDMSTLKRGSIEGISKPVLSHKTPVKKGRGSSTNVDAGTDLCNRERSNGYRCRRTKDLIFFGAGRGEPHDRKNQRILSFRASQ
jgi:hypothetical protein